MKRLPVLQIGPFRVYPRCVERIYAWRKWCYTAASAGIVWGQRTAVLSPHKEQHRVTPPLMYRIMGPSK